MGSKLRKRPYHEMMDESEASASEFQVFLSFRGPDCRQGLADVMYDYMTTAGIRVFRDNDELEVGDEISKILPAIKNSKICVPILSKGFASSTWCLCEVERMVQLKKTIIPIFYTATPDDVKLRTEVFKKDMKKHEKKHGIEQVKKWEDALKTIAKIKGWEVKTTGFAEFSTSFVKALLIKLKVRQIPVNNCLVKRDNQVEAVMRMLDTCAEDTRLIGIYGMGGIGKTTLAKVVFNQLSHQFDCCSFLENIQESLRRHGLQYLQKQLLEDLKPKLKNFGKIDPLRMLRENFLKSKVLIVLDDVNERKQIETITGMLGWFGMGSRIVVTTRNKRVLTREEWAFQVEEMDNDQALQLFSRHAFGEDVPPIDYHFLSNEVLSLTGRVPLAIEVIGSLLHQCEKKIWRATIEKLKKVMSKDIKEKLKISFDALGKEEKQIFLDIACFFISKERSTAIYLWEACDYFPDVGIEVLVSLSLVKITDKNKFWMHNLIRDLGREIVREECFGDPTRRSRIWTCEEAFEVLKIKQRKEKVEGLFQELRGDSSLTDEHFSSFQNLRLLKLVDVKLVGDFEDLLPKLKWFTWHRCPSYFDTINLSLRKLVVLDLSHSFISERWAGWSLIQMAKNLKALDLNWCCNLSSTPDLSSNTSLERLSLRGCRCLVELHGSIICLKRLKHLDLKGCHSLKVLPENIDLLEDLEEILVDGNGNAFNIPNSIGNLHSLVALELRGVEITRIPDTVGGLVNLTRLSLNQCIGMTRLPDTIGNLNSLEELDLSETRINMLPESIGNLGKLGVLNLCKTKVTTLPDSIGELVELTRLDMSYSKMTVLPDSIGKLGKLTELHLICTKITALPESIGDLAGLTVLILSNTKMTALPDSIGNLAELTYLGLNNTKITVLPDSVGKLVKLCTLNLRLSAMVMLPDWVGNFCKLEKLIVGGSRIRRIPSTIWSLPLLSVLVATSYNYTPPVLTEHQIHSKLRELRLQVSSAAEISPVIDQHPGLRKLHIEFRENSSEEKRLVPPSCHGTEHMMNRPNELSSNHSSLTNSPFDLGAFTCFTELFLDCSGLKGIVMQPFPSTLKFLYLSHITPETKLPNLSNLTKLECIHFWDCSPHAELEGLRLLEGLTRVTIIKCTDELVDFSCQMESLTDLYISVHPESSTTCLDLSHMKGLSALALVEFEELTEVRGLRMLDKIYIEKCPSLRNIEELKRRCRQGYFDGLEVRNLVDRDIDGCSSRPTASD